MKLKSSGRKFKSGARMSITTKIAINLSFLIIFLIAMVGISLIFRDKIILKKEFEVKGRNILQTALVSSASNIQAGNFDSLKAIVKTIGGYQDVRFAMVLDAGGNVLSFFSGNQPGYIIGTEEAKRAVAAKAGVPIILPGGQGRPDVMEISYPINSAGGVAGYICLGYDLSAIKNYTRDTTMFILLICVASVIAGISLARLISKKILQRPLSDLTAATERVSTGDFSYKVPVHEQDELGDLATAFNTMTVHLANLIQSVKSSAVDINKSAEKILERLRTSGNTNVKLSHTFDLLKEGTEGQIDVLKHSIAISEQLSDQSKHAMDCVLQILSEVNKTIQVSESGLSSVSRIGGNIEESSESLKITGNSLRELEYKGRQLYQVINHFNSLLEKNLTFTVQAALEAARSGNEELAGAAEELHSITEESVRSIRQMSEELGEIQNGFSEAENALEGNLKSLAGGQEAVNEARSTLETVLHSLSQSKDFIEEIASSAHQQSTSIEDMKNCQSGIVDELLKFANNSSGAGNDTKLQAENLNDIDSLAKKLVRMVDRLNVLSLQFKI